MIPRGDCDCVSFPPASLRPTPRSVPPSPPAPAATCAVRPGALRPPPRRAPSSCVFFSLRLPRHCPLLPRRFRWLHSRTVRRLMPAMYRSYRRQEHHHHHNSPPPSLAPPPPPPLLAVPVSPPPRGVPRTVSTTPRCLNTHGARWRWTQCPMVPALTALPALLHLHLHRRLYRRVTYRHHGAVAASLQAH